MRSHRAESHSVDPGLIELELTEHSLMEDTDGTRECLRALKNIGVRLAIDEFGAGYSCLDTCGSFRSTCSRSTVRSSQTSTRTKTPRSSAAPSCRSPTVCRWTPWPTHRVGGTGVVLDEERLPVRSGQLLQRAADRRSDRRDDGREGWAGDPTSSSHEQTYSREGRMRGTSVCEAAG